MARSNRREAGRRRLAMRLPQMRKLIMEARDPWLLELFEAYQMAVEARDLFESDGSIRTWCKSTTRPVW